MARKFYLLSVITAVLSIILGAVTNQLNVGLSIHRNKAEPVFG